MQIESKQKIKPVTRNEALSALWSVKLRLGQPPIHILWTEAEQLRVFGRLQKWVVLEPGSPDDLDI